MANVSYWYGSWISAEGGDLNPGESHHWSMWGFEYGDAVSVTAHPVVLADHLVERVLSVENVRVEGYLSGRKLHFSVRNSGNHPVPIYGMGFSMISHQ